MSCVQLSPHLSGLIARHEDSAEGALSQRFLIVASIKRDGTAVYGLASDVADKAGALISSQPAWITMRELSSLRERVLRDSMARCVFPD